MVAYVPRVTERFTTGEVTCPVRITTGWLCPFCGMTRGTVSLLHGQVASALEYNAFVPVYVVGLAVLLLGAYGVRRPRPLEALPAGALRASLLIVGLSFVAYSVLRNVVAA